MLNICVFFAISTVHKLIAVMLIKKISVFQPDDDEVFSRNQTYPTIEPSTNPDSDDDDEWIHDGDSADEDRNIFDILDDEQF